MHRSKLKRGMKVRISSDISKTHNAHGSNDEMNDLRGTIQTIDKIPTSSLRYVVIKNHTWAIEDIEEVIAKKIEPQMFHFDPKHL